MNRTINLYNTLTRSIQPLVPVHRNEVRMYSCGPTVYNTAHIGNLRAFLAADVIQRVCRYVGGYAMRWVMNITDIDDKIIRDSSRGSEAWNVAMGEQQNNAHGNMRMFTEYYTAQFLQDIQSIGINKSDFFSMPRATDFVPHMMELIRVIVQNGFAYVADGSVYFDVRSYQQHFQYGRLFALHPDAMQTGVRIDADEYSRDQVSDFALWKAAKPGEPSWSFELNGQHLEGRPGWHIECSAMSEHLLGLPFDIHTGGIDLRFPHHEDEMAQCCAGYGLRCGSQANIWMHNEFLEVEGRKMSKSLNNFYTVADIQSMGVSMLDLRYAMIQTHYRSVYNFSAGGLATSSAARNNIQEYASTLLERVPGDIPSVLRDARPNGELLDPVFEWLANDIHTPKALAQLFVYIGNNSAASVKNPEQVLRALHEINNVLGIITIERKQKIVPPENITQLAVARWQAKQEKNWQRADAIRDELIALGWEMTDTKNSYTLKPRVN
jgi:cysteinyl-tRNA synthetase